MSPQKDMKVILALFLFEVQTFAGWLSRDKVDRSRIEVIHAINVYMYWCANSMLPIPGQPTCKPL